MKPNPGATSPRARTPTSAAAADDASASLRDPARRREDSTWWLVFGAWLVATTATLGALFFSEVMQLPPCLLCWYQRIFMFPLVLLLPLGLFPFDPRIVRYALPLAGTGTAIAVYHQGLVMGVVAQSASPCQRGVPCAEVQVEWLGFVTIPLLSVAAFTSIVALLALAGARRSK
jgi:disulfide bond formation protein DsbB